MLQLLPLLVTAVVLGGPWSVLRPVADGALPESRITFLLESPDRRVRAFAPHLQQGVSEGLRRSPTFAAMLVALEETDVIVQVVQMMLPSSAARARIVLVNGQKTYRFLRIQIGENQQGDDLVALLGHELFHALEIAAVPGIRSEEDLAAHYERIGFRTGRAQQFDTREARTIERRVRSELGGARTSTARANSVQAGR